MNTIYKYTLERIDFQQIEMPLGARILHADLQHGAICLWVEVSLDGSGLTELRNINMRGTGQYFPSEPVARYVDTVLDGAYVWHIYDYGVL